MLINNEWARKFSNSTRIVLSEITCETFRYRYRMLSHEYFMTWRSKRSRKKFYSKRNSHLRRFFNKSSSSSPTVAIFQESGWFDLQRPFFLSFPFSAFWYHFANQMSELQLRQSIFEIIRLRDFNFFCEKFMWRESAVQFVKSFELKTM